MLERVLLLLVVTSLANGQLSADKETLLNWCMDARHHKTQPGREADLYSQCVPWKDRACCTANTTRNIHLMDMYNFSYDHCPGKKMSEKCRRHFRQDLCFYECSPNLGPWMVKTNMKIRNERAFRVPLCATDCISWFEDCRNEYTCTDNWTRNFRWVNGTNQCPPNASCHTFLTVYGNAKKFCETVWDHSWEYTEDELPCMQVWFQSTGGNPNDRVAELRAQAIARQAGAAPGTETPHTLLLLLLNAAALSAALTRLV